MAKKFFILLFITIFCSGVTYSSVITGQQISDVVPPEEKPPTEDHINKKTEPTVVPAAQPIPKANATNPQLPAGQNATLPSGSATPQVANGNVTGGATAHDPAEKPTHQTVDNKKASQMDVKNANQTTADVKNTVQSTEPGKHGSLPGDEKNTMNPTVAPGKINTDIPPPSQTEQTPPSKTTAAATPAPSSATTPAPSSATTAAPTTAKPTVSTPSPTLVVEHNVPAPVQEKHFDGPSFIGGIVLTIGLTAIGFIAFKYYKSSKIDLNYRTL